MPAFNARPTAFVMSQVYRELDFDRLEFRVLELDLDDSASRIRCSLRHEVLTDAPQYVALSYVWGDPKATTDIIVNNETVPITLNLDSALRYCRRTGTSVLWADALCINQTDTQEKSRQVRQMKDIYSKATHTISWLGENPNLSIETAFEFLQELKRVAETHEHDHHHHDDSLAERVKLISSQARTSLAHGLLKSKPWFEEEATAAWLTKGFHATLDLFRCAYWTRRWIIQEIVVSRDVQVVHAHAMMPFNELVSMMKICQSLPNWPGEQDPGFQYFWTICQIQQKYQSREPLRLMDTLQSTFKYNSQDARDKIFALLGLCVDAQTLVPLASYYQDPMHIARDLTRALIQNRVPMDIILLGRGSDAQSPAATSWTMDLLASSINRRLPMYALRRTQPIDQSCVNRALSSSADSLHMRGVVLGTVVQLSSVLQVDKPTVGGFEHEAAFVDRSTVFEYYKQDIHFALARSLTSDHWWGPMIERRRGIKWFFVPDMPDDNKRIYNSMRFLSHCIRSRGKLARNTIQFPHGNDVRRIVDHYIHWLEANEKLMDNTQGMGLLRKRVSWRYHLRTIEEVGILTVLAIVWCAIFIHLLTIPGFVPGPAVVGVLIALCFFGFLMLGYTLWDLMKFYCFRLRVSEFELALQNPRRVFVCDSGLMGIAGPGTKLGDKIALLGGCRNGAVLRQTTTPGSSAFSVVGVSSPCLREPDFPRYEMLRTGKEVTNDSRKASASMSVADWNQDIMLV